MNRAIADYHKDDENHWVARLTCGHFQHVRHNPPWTNRPWVETLAGRNSMIGHELNCKKCDEGAPLDYQVL
ncbi:DUF3565 domain-containing protein [Colwellia sp. UCD-KL20]|uniref:DUF3565 domain-containing protein n=1 Tax=Colwellia sp. UCD-KL20 TaxID=1917165 RepID=UPI000970D233|nr:DUF3565 domain-containing protein [Colwellia sp. UCD-KL20]